MSSPDWTPEARDIPDELTDEYERADYTPPIHWATVQDKIDHASLATLREWMRSGIGEPDARQ